jgi:hypothetical protein
MSEVDRQSPLAPAVRFHLRSVMAATTMLALLAGATGALARSVPANMRAGVLTRWGCDVAVVALVVAWHWRKRRQNVRAAGEVHFILRQTQPVRGAWRRLPLLWTLFLLIPAGRLWETINPVSTGRPTPWGVVIGESVFMLPFMWVAVSQVINFIMSLRPVCLTENGLLAGDEFIGWRQISIVRWHDLVRDQLQISTWSATVRYSLTVPPMLRDNVGALLCAKTCLADTSVA